jgi:acetyl esterase/lipase
MTRRSLLSLLAATATTALGGCSVLDLFSTFTPRDSARHPGAAIAYGPHPRQTLDVYVPQKGSGPWPTVMFFYGGGWNSGSRGEYGWAAQAIASRGFLVIVPDYRLVPEVIYPAFVEDCAQSVRWAQDHAAQYGGDPGRILLIGHSAGAYMALQLALDDDFLRAAGVDYACIKGAVGLSGPYDFYPFDVKESRDAFGPYRGDPKATQPITYAARASRPPVLLIQGLADTLVGPHNAINLDKALRAAGNRSTLRLYPGFSHPDTVTPLSIPFRGKAPILAEVVTFLRAAAG